MKVGEKHGRFFVFFPLSSTDSTGILNKKKHIETVYICGDALLEVMMKWEQNAVEGDFESLIYCQEENKRSDR